MRPYTEGRVIGMQNQESLLEIGFVLFGLSILAGIVALVYGQTQGGRHQGARRAQNAPARGSVSTERHQNIQTVSAR